MFSCNVCDKQFSDFHALGGHAAWHTRIKAREKLVSVASLTDEFAYLLGFNLGDGCISHTRPHYRITFTNTNQRIIERVKEYLCNLGFKYSESINKPSGWRKKDEHVVEIGSCKPFYELVLKIKNNPECILDVLRNIRQRLFFIGGFYDAEGCFTIKTRKFPNGKQYPEPYVSLSNFNQKIKECVKRVLEALGYHPWLGKAELALCRKAEAKRFCKEVQEYSVKLQYAEERKKR